LNEINSLKKFPNVKHVCYIIDGTRTYAILKRIKNNRIYEYAYISGALQLQRLFEMTFNDFKIPFLTVAVTTRQNHLKRARTMKTIPEHVPFFAKEKWLDYFKSNKVRVKFIGDRKLFVAAAKNRAEVLNYMRDIEKETMQFNRFHFFVMVAYDARYEYIKLLHSTKTNSISKLIKKYYGLNVPPVDIIIRSWRPRLSLCIPILVGEYADVYFFPQPFQYFNKKHYESILRDYSSRIKSKGGGFLYSKKEIQKIRKLKNLITKQKPLIIGRKVGNAWIPIPTK